MAALRMRIAPTPSGFLHVGNGISFVATWCLCRLNNGRLQLRIDDLDTTRFRQEYLEDIFFTLEWLGLDYDEGPGGPSDFLENFSQIHRLSLYQEALHELVRSGQVYACGCSRKQLRRIFSEGRHFCTCRDRKLALDTPEVAWRIAVPVGKEISIRNWQADPSHIDLAKEMGDFVVRRKDGNPAYQLASLLDDLHWRINFIVRGSDLLPSTAAQLYLAEILGKSTFERVTFWHHPLILNEKGKKLAKSKDASSLRQWRNSGLSPQKLYETAAGWLGVTPVAEIGTPAELLDLLKHRKEKQEEG